jgi:cytochrome P450
MDANLRYSGGDTIATGMSAAFFYLSRYPKCYEKLVAEIRSTFDNGSDIKKGAKLAGCHYLRACINESLRMSPPLSGTLWREQTSTTDNNEPLYIEGQYIPPGTHFGVNMYSLHHNEDYFPDPFAFHPDRWIDPNVPTVQKKLMHDAFSPFSIGPRSCPGKSMAYLEASLVLARTVWYFDFDRASGELGDVGGGKKGKQWRERPDEYQIYDTFNAAHEGPYLVFRPRGNLVEDFAIQKT